MSDLTTSLDRPQRDKPGTISSPLATRLARELLAGLSGFRLRPDTEATFETLATLQDTSMRALVLAALSDSGKVSQRVHARPFGAVEEADWSLPALSFANIAWGLLKPDPGERQGRGLGRDRPRGTACSGG